MHELGASSRTWWLLALVVIAGVGGCSHDERTPREEATTETAVASTPPVAVAPVVAPPPPRTPVDEIMEQATLPEAIAVALPKMTDTDDETSPGALLLALWAAKHLTWSAVTVAKNETSFALVHKDSDAARGKRLCVRGSIVQISKLDLVDRVVFHGLMLSGYSDLVSFIAAGSTGELVEQSGARFCGVVIGTYDYSNSAGGKGHATSLVGMFDLPENRAH